MVEALSVSAPHDLQLEHRHSVTNPPLVSLLIHLVYKSLKRLRRPKSATQRTYYSSIQDSIETQTRTAYLNIHFALSNVTSIRGCHKQDKQS